MRYLLLGVSLFFSSNRIKNLSTRLKVEKVLKDSDEKLNIKNKTTS